MEILPLSTETKKLGSTSIRAVLYALNKLTDSGELSAYVDSKTLMQCASSHESKQRVAIPHRLYQRILSRALEVVETYHPYRHDISNVMAEAYNIQKRVKSGEKLATDRRGFDELSMSPEGIEQRVTRNIKRIVHDIPDFKVSLKGVALSEIMASCLIIVQGFSGVRIGEAVSFNANSAGEITVNGKKVTVLKGETTKGHNAKPKVVTWQSHPVAKVALELAYDMMAFARKYYQEGLMKKKDKVKPQKILTI